MDIAWLQGRLDHFSRHTDVHGNTKENQGGCGNHFPRPCQTTSAPVEYEFSLQYDNRSACSVQCGAASSSRKRSRGSEVEGYDINNFQRPRIDLHVTSSSCSHNIF
mmetsp:Transcript_9955/g.15018  ORF Transcript_9955/g.15018 Transcript_9955/m.15018 type:complete len:106 (+) Transcript_9955:84-401(+)